MLQNPTDGRAGEISSCRAPARPLSYISYISYDSGPYPPRRMPTARLSGSQTAEGRVSFGKGRSRARACRGSPAALPIPPCCAPAHTAGRSGSPWPRAASPGGPTGGTGGRRASVMAGLRSGSPDGHGLLVEAAGGPCLGRTRVRFGFVMARRPALSGLDRTYHKPVAPGRAAGGFWGSNPRSSFLYK